MLAAAPPAPARPVLWPLSSLIRRPLPRTKSPRLAMRCKPQSRLAPHSTSVLKPRRVKAKPCGRASRGLDPNTTGGLPTKRQPLKKEGGLPTRGRAARMCLYAKIPPSTGSPSSSSARKPLWRLAKMLLPTTDGRRGQSFTHMSEGTLCQKLIRSDCANASRSLDAHWIAIEIHPKRLMLHWIVSCPGQSTAQRASQEQQAVVRPRHLMAAEQRCRRR